MKKKTRIYKFWFLQTFVIPIAWLVARLYFKTWRIDPELRRQTLAVTNSHPNIFIYWHTHILMAIGMLYRIHRDMENPVVILLSPSKDGELVEKLLQKMGQRVVRGSSNKNSVRSLVILRKEIDKGANPLFPVDGPKGPRGVPKPGPFLLADKESISPSIGFFHPSRCWRLKSWDKHMVPMPFANLEGVVEQHPDWETGIDRDVFLKNMQQMFLDNSEKYGQDVSDVERL